MCFYSRPRTITATANASAVVGCLKPPALCLLPPSLPSQIKTMSLQHSYSCNKLRFQEAETINCSIPWTTVVLLLRVVGVWLFRLLTCPEQQDLIFFSSFTDGHTQILQHTVMHAKHCLPHFSFFVLTLNIQLFASLSSSQFISHQSVLTYSQPTGEVSHDTQDADTKISHLIYFGSVYVCQSLFVSLPSFHLYTLRSPCCAHR